MPECSIYFNIPKQNIKSSVTYFSLGIHAAVEQQWKHLIMRCLWVVCVGLGSKIRLKTLVDFLLRTLKCDKN